MAPKPSSLPGKNCPPRFNTRHLASTGSPNTGNYGERETVTSAEMDPGAKDAPTHGVPHSDRPADRYAISFRRQFLIVTVCLLAVNLMIGLFARQQQRSIIDYAINIYDTAFISTNYVSLAQIAFQHYIDDRSRATEPAQAAKANELLENVFDDMDVAIERSSSNRTRVEAQEIKAEIAELL